MFRRNVSLSLAVSCFWCVSGNVNEIVCLSAAFLSVCLAGWLPVVRVCSSSSFFLRKEVSSLVTSFEIIAAAGSAVSLYDILSQR